MRKHTKVECSFIVAGKRISWVKVLDQRKWKIRSIVVMLALKAVLEYLLYPGVSGKKPLKNLKPWSYNPSIQEVAIEGLGV